MLCRKQSSNEDKSKSDLDNSTADLHPLVSVTQIDPEEIPKDPESRFLNRIREDKDKENEPKNDDNERPPIKKKPRIRGYTKSGRVIKGRGALVSCLLMLTQWVNQFVLVILDR